MTVTAPTANVGARRGAGGRSRRRVVLIAAGVLVLAVAVVGYLFVSGTFDEDVQTGALVAAVDIEAGAVVSSADFTFTYVDLTGIPHVPWTDDAPFFFDGLVAVGPIPAGLPVLDAMFRSRQSAPFEDELEVVLELDLSATPTEVNEGDLVLLVDPGVPPLPGEAGRAPSVIGSLELQQFDGATTRLFASPEEWAYWRGLAAELGAPPQVLPVPLGGDPDDMAARLNATWQAAYDAESGVLAELEAQLAAETAEPAPGPGELEVVVELDPSLSATPPAEGDLVLLVDPGVAPFADEPGRPRRVLQPLELANFDGTSVRLFVPPDEWARWTALPAELGGAPLALVVDPEADTDAMAAALNAGWQANHEAAVAAAAEDAAELADLLALSLPAPGTLAVDVPLDTSLSTLPPIQGDLVLLIDPGSPPTADDQGRPRQVLQTLELTNFDGLAARLFAPPEVWHRWRALPDDLGGIPMALPVAPGSDIAEMAAALDAAWQADYEVALAAVAEDAAELADLPEGWFWVSLPVDSAGSPLRLNEGDIVFLVDPGRPAVFDSEGAVVTPRIPPNAIEWRLLEGWDGQSLNFWAPPDRYAYYTYLQERLEGRVPLVLPAVTGELDEAGLEALLRRLNSAFDRWAP